MRITITCEDCGRRHRLERMVADPGELWIVCHDCEVPLRAVLESAPVSPAVAPAPVHPGPAFLRAWVGTLDMAGDTAGAERPTELPG